jgi:hypothetical protein
MRLLWISMVAGTAFVLSSCFLHMEGRPPPKYDAPYGALFVKPGMTREGRLQDLAACGGHSGYMVNFTKEQHEEASKATNEFVPDKNNDGYFILLRRLQKCMTSKGYHQLPMYTCTGNDPKVMEPCMYP